MKKHFIFILAVQLLFTAAQAQQSYTIKFNPKSGDNYQVASKSEVQVAQNVMGQDINIDMVNNVDMNYEIADAEQNKQLTLTYDKLYMEMAVMGNKTVMDSENPDTTTQIGDAFRRLKGQQIKLTIQPDGKVSKIEGTDELIKNLGAMDEGEKKMLEGVIGEKALARMMEMSFSFYPANPVKVGDSWNSESSMEEPFPMKVQSTHTLTKVEGNRAVIVTKSTLATLPGATMTQMGMELGLDLSGTMDSESTIELDSGMPVTTTGGQHLKGNIEVQGQKVPMAVNSTSTTEMQKK